jgi:hypothetical protein
MRREIPSEARELGPAPHDVANRLRLQGFGDTGSPNSSKDRALRDAGGVWAR